MRGDEGGGDEGRGDGETRVIGDSETEAFFGLACNGTMALVLCRNSNRNKNGLL